MTAVKIHKGVVLTGLLTVILPLAVCQFSLRRTVEQYQAYRHNVKIIEQETASEAAFVLPMEKQHAGKGSIKNGQLMESLMPQLHKNGLTADAFIPYLTMEDNNYEIYTGKLTFSGSFAGSLRLIDYIEKNAGFGQIISVNYQITTTPADKSRVLKVTLFLQQLHEK